MVINVVRKQGWKFIPDQILPPLIANSTGVILYATYLTTLDYYTKQHEKNKVELHTLLVVAVVVLLLLLLLLVGKF